MIDMIDMFGMINTDKLKELLKTAAPGPWKYEEYEDESFTVSDKNGKAIAVFEDGGAGEAEYAANAKLTALAPYLAALVINFEKENYMLRMDRVMAQIPATFKWP